MDKAITTALFIVISMVLAMLLFNATYPAVIQGSDSLSRMALDAQDRLLSDLQIIHAAGEMDSNAWWQDSNANGYFEVFIWVKNTGLNRIASPESLDVFFGREGAFVYIPEASRAGANYPQWSWAIENGTSWDPTTTLRITVRYGTTPLPGRYAIKLSLPNGITAEGFVGL